jgi:hypothetical protein
MLSYTGNKLYQNWNKTATITPKDTWGWKTKLHKIPSQFLCGITATPVATKID